VLFALVGAVAAPIGGRLAGAGHTRAMSALAMALGVLDFAVQMNMVLGQRAVYSLEPASRGNPLARRTGSQRS